MLLGSQRPSLFCLIPGTPSHIYDTDLAFVLKIQESFPVLKKKLKSSVLTQTAIANVPSLSLYLTISA